MKASPTLIVATAILWIGTLVGSYQLGQRTVASAGDTDAANLAARNGSAAGTDASSARSSRSARTRSHTDENQLTVKQVFAQLKATLRPGSMQNPTSMMRAMSLLDKLSPEDLPAALAEAEAMKDQQGKMLVYMALLGKWAERDGPAAMKYAQEHSKEPGMAGAVMKMSVAASWAESDPQAVWAWYQENKEEESGGMLGGNQLMLTSIFSNLMRTDPDTAFKRLDELDSSPKQMALAGMCQTAIFDDQQRQIMLKKIDTMPEGTDRTSTRQMLLSQWMMFAPDEATSWVAQQSAAEQTELRKSLGTMLFMTDPEKGAEFVMTGATEQEKPERYAAVINSWAHRDATAASTWLAEQGEGPQLDQARNSLVNALTSKDPAAAMNHAQAITDPDQRLNATSQVYQTWRAKDPTAAEDALDHSGLTPEQLESLRSPEQP
ncbi:MAG: hypothetical protein K9N23_13350 [Akkermansiaceae bacterium]|nr:hypothetical protein [Akkermansiaceae bacterium]